MPAQDRSTGRVPGVFRLPEIFEQLEGAQSEEYINAGQANRLAGILGSSGMTGGVARALCPNRGPGHGFGMSYRSYTLSIS